MGSCAGVFQALERGTGRVRWSYDIRADGDQNNFHGDPLVAGDLVVTGTDGGARATGMGHVYAFETATGKVRWKRPAGSGVGTDIVRLGSRVYGVTLGDELICLDLATGKLEWSFPSGAANESLFIGASPALTGERVFFGGLNGTEFALDARTGQPLWRKNLGSRIVRFAGVLGDSVYAATEDGSIYRLRQDTGEMLSSFSGTEAAAGPPILTDGALVVVFGQRTVARLDPSSLEIRWFQDAPGLWSSSRPLLWGDQVVVGAEDGGVFAFRMADGSPAWQARIDGPVAGVGGTAGELYVGTRKGKIVALAPAAAGAH